MFGIDVVHVQNHGKPSKGIRFLSLDAIGFLASLRVQVKESQQAIPASPRKAGGSFHRMGHTHPCTYAV